MSSRIRFFSDNIDFAIKQKTLIRSWIGETILNEDRKLKDLNIVFCDDEILSDINRKYLKHNTLTDIVTFSLADDPEEISGEIYISIERVEDNAMKFDKTFVDEVNRVIIHGVLHLAGFDDKTIPEKKKMRMKEDFYLGRLGKSNGVTK